MRMEKKLPNIGKHMPQFSMEERDRRWGRIREKMAAAQLDALLIFSSNATYNMSSANMLQANIGNGGEDTMIMLDSGSPPLLHGRPAPGTTRKLEKGDMIITEYHSNYAGYTIAVEHTFSLGEPLKEFKEIHRVSETAYHNGVSKMRPGAELTEVIEAFRQPVRDAGMAYIEVGVCGHGLSSPEFPSVVFGGEGGIWHEHGLAKIPPVQLKENMVFGINMDVHNPKWNENTGTMLGDTIWVTADGPRQLTRIPVELTVL